MNIERFKDDDKRSLNTLKLAIQKIDVMGKEITWYLPSCFQSNSHFDPKLKGVRMTCYGKTNKAAPAFKEEKWELDFFHLIERVFFLTGSSEFPHVCR